MGFDLLTIVLIAGIVLAVLMIFGIKIVPQSKNYTVETMGKYSRTLKDRKSTRLNSSH